MFKRFIPPCLTLIGAIATLGPTVASASDDTALVNAGLIDGNGGPRVPSATVLIHGDRIAAIGPTGTIAVSPDATVIDCAGRTVMPGLVADHCHLGLVDGTASGPGHYTRENVLRQLRQYEVYGVTTIASLGINSPLFYELRPALHAGTLPGADAFGADRGIGAPNSVPPPAMAGDVVDRPASADEARATSGRRWAGGPT